MARTAMTPTMGQLNLCLQRGHILFRIGRLRQRVVPPDQPQGGCVHTHRHRRVTLFHTLQRGDRHLHALGPLAQGFATALACDRQITAEHAK